jgi:hypothetical protein
VEKLLYGGTLGLGSAACAVWEWGLEERKERRLDKQPLQQALDAIHDEASKLLEMDITPEVQEKIELIISLARHGFDVRTDAEQGKPFILDTIEKAPDSGKI